MDVVGSGLCVVLPLIGKEMITFTHKMRDGQHQICWRHALVNVCTSPPSIATSHR
jgi:hypothetical protein